MAMQRLGRRVATTRVWHGTTVALVPAAPTGEIVVSLHGWPGDDPASTALDGLVRSGRTGAGFPVDALLATGHTIIYPWLGASWGTAASSEQAFSDAAAMVEKLDLGVTAAHIIGGSMGGLNAITFAALEGAETWPIILYAPLVSMGEAWDLGGAVRTSVESVWGVGRETVVTAAAEVDPAQVDCSFLAGRTLVCAASNDPLINYSTVQAWCTQWDLPLITTATGHFSMDDPNVVETDLLSWFHSAEVKP